MDYRLFTIEYTCNYVCAARRYQSARSEGNGGI
jgi:hypothetical protein